MLKVWSKRHRDLARPRNQVACRLHAVLCDLVPGGHRRRSPQLTLPGSWSRPPVRRCRAGPRRAGRRVPRGPAPPGCPAARHPQEARRRGQGLRHHPHRGVRRRPGHRRHRHRRRRATCPGSPAATTSPPITAPPRSRCPPGTAKIHRLSLRGNRRINHAIHMAAITQIRHKHSDGRAYYDKKIAEGKTHKEALRSLKRRVSDAIYARLLADARRAG